MQIGLKVATVIVIGLVAMAAGSYLAALVVMAVVDFIMRVVGLKGGPAGFKPGGRSMSRMNDSDLLISAKPSDPGKPEPPHPGPSQPPKPPPRPSGPKGRSGQ